MIMETLQTKVWLDIRAMPKNAGWRTVLETRSGTVVYRSIRCASKDRAVDLACAWLDKHPQYALPRDESALMDRSRAVVRDTGITVTGPTKLTEAQHKGVAIHGRLERHLAENPNIRITGGGVLVDPSLFTAAPVPQWECGECERDAPEDQRICPACGHRGAPAKRIS